jgi:hypothetical protein
MEEFDPRIRSMLRQAQRVAESGKRAAAEKLYRQLVEESPQTVPAWLGLAGIVRDPAEREAAYRQALFLDPGNEAAEAGLASLNQVAPVATGVAEPETVVAPEPAEIEPAEQEPLSTPESGNGQASEADTGVLFCTNHAGRRTNLRCNRCGRPMCTRCVRLTPVGYRCKDCIYEQQEVYFNATALHYVIAAIVALPLGAIGGFLANALGFWIIFIAAGAGTLMGRIVFRLIGRRRGRWLPHLVAVMLVIGSLTGVLLRLIGVALMVTLTDAGLAQLSGMMTSFIWPIIFAVVAAGSAYYQMK